MNHKASLFPRSVAVASLLVMVNMCFFVSIPNTFAAAPCLPGLPCTTFIIDPDNPTATGPNAPKSDSEACDANFMNQIYSRAFLEAQREIITNGTVFRKPDSILEYTCFDKFVSLTAHHAGPIFSETDRFHNVLVDVSARGLGAVVPAAETIAAIADLDPEALGDLLPLLSAEAVAGVLGELTVDEILNIDPAAIADAVLNFASVNAEDILAGLTEAAQDAIIAQVREAIPESILSLIDDVATAAEFLEAIQNLSAEDIRAAAEDAVQNAIQEATDQAAEEVGQLVEAFAEKIGIPEATALLDTLQNPGPAIAALADETLAQVAPGLSIDTITTVLNDPQGALTEQAQNIFFENIPIDQAADIINQLQNPQVAENYIQYLLALA